MSAAIEPIALNELVARCGFGRGELISLVGGGGKTTTLFALGRQLPGTTVLTTTTKMGSDRTEGLPLLLSPSDDQLATAVVDHPTLVWSDATGHRATGVSAADCDRWFGDIGAIDNVVVEADGSRRKPFKAPAEHEPVIPAASTTVIACIGAGAIGRPIAESCHRPELVAALAGCTVHDLLTPSRAAMVLTSANGSRKGVPPTARFVIAVCGVEPSQADAAAEVAARVADLHGDAEVIAIAATG